MSETTTQGPAVEPLAQNFRPQDNIFRSFNVLNPAISENLMSNLTTVRRGDMSEYITIADDTGDFDSDFQEHSSSIESMETFSASVGIKGSYGVFSASANWNTETTETSSFTALHSTYVAVVPMGIISLNALTREEKLEQLHPRMVSELKAISSLADAQAFTEKWGTHLVTRVQTGGMVLVSNSVETGSFESRAKAATKIKGSYTSKSLELTIATSSEIKKEWGNIKQVIKVRGGDVHLAAAFNSDGRGVSEWVKSVTADTTFAIADSIEIFTLTEGVARETLKKYIDLTMLAFSLNHPAIFTVGASAPFNSRPVTVTGRPGSGFKIIGGGATVTQRSNNFLMGSYPNSNHGSAPDGWTAVARDLMSPSAASDTLASYALGVHDPEDYLDIMVAEGKGSNAGIGRDEAEATLPNGWVLTCGGALSEATTSRIYKFLTASHFNENQLRKQTWKAACSDYKVAASNVKLHAFAVGIKSKDPLLAIEGVYRSSHGVFEQWGNPSAVAAGFACGGGFDVSGNTGAGNLVQESYPSSSKKWQVFNKDHDSSVSAASSKAFAVSLQASVVI
ncbi:MAC/perforin domain-containing protein [Mucilaginibacter sp. X4EP1]|uniref:MAC/perforin domain-containing protein n=1 Tax=Mucilaginibacter sp. X4EP1 TaxID=2723092 RepID=UPI00216857A2|nr:MAC/perforin domain-containing protein [Mucilaginibacter sp. X4EP1]MCS3813609.1 hypothetical protein [Mucilaginibacter sp. X4EP1]